MTLEFNLLAYLLLKVGLKTVWFSMVLTLMVAYVLPEKEAKLLVSTIKQIYAKHLVSSHLLFFKNS